MSASNPESISDIETSEIDLTSAEMALVAAEAIDDKKGTDVAILDVGELLRIADVFVIATGSSRRQVQAMAEEVADQLRLFDRRPLRVEGKEVGDWVLVDYGDLIVHLFQPEPRDFYSLERLWGDAPRIAWEPQEPVEGLTESVESS